MSTPPGEPPPPPTPLERFTREHSSSVALWRPMLRMSYGDATESFQTCILGVHERHNFVLAAPRRADGSFVSVLEGQTWLFRTLYHTTALRFQASVLRVAFEPLPHIFVEIPQAVERHAVRSTWRVPVALPATLLLPEPAPALILDLSLGGARIALSNEASPIAMAQSVTCSAAFMIQERRYALDLKAVVLSRDPDVQERPGVAVYRLRFESVSDTALLTLQAFLSTTLVDELDTFWRLVVDPRAG